mgnify:CR=1 FL=1
MRFLGNIEAKLDTKGRVFIPALFRKKIAEGTLILRKDIFQNCLVLYPEEVWNKELNELKQRLNKWNANHQQVFRQFVSDVEILSMDANGRILIPRRYLQMTEIIGEVRFIGMDEKIEGWPSQVTETPFMSPDKFGAAIEELMQEEKTTQDE